MTRLKAKTAEEFVEELERDPAHRARRAMQDAATARRATVATMDEATIVRDLAAAGVQVASVYDFVNDVVTPAEVVPILFRHLQRPHIPVIREGLFRALSYSHLRENALSNLKALFRVADEPDERWIIANAISAMATFKEVADLPGIEEHKKLFKQTAAKRRKR